MDDNQQKQVINDSPQATSQPQATPVPVSGSLNKEAEIPAAPYIVHSEQELKIDEELKAAGVENISDKPGLTPAHEIVGIKHSLENNVPNLEPTVSIKFPLEDNQVQQIAKKGNTQASVYWLSQLIIKIKKVLLKAKKND